MSTKLTKREYEVLTRFGKNDADIAYELNISINTVKNISKLLFRKLGVNTRTQAVIKAIRLELVNEYSFFL